MGEMIYGNTGKRDEGINIDMEQTLYQKLQSVTFVPKLKKMLNDNLQSGDKNFIFIGEIQDKSGNFSIFGYNAKLENDMRGGDYGHYIAIPADGKTVKADFSSVNFLTEDGFIEYVYDNTLNNGKRFSLNATPVDVDINAKKRIVNNIMEVFTRARKRKNVCVSLDENDVNVFSNKSLSFLLDIMKYLPYCMRKNISFISHVNSIEKLPEMINLAVYSESCANKPHDCISLNGGSLNAAEGIFYGYVEKVFSMSDAEREAYFEYIYNVIEIPAINKGVAVRSDIYLLDVSTKELWQKGDVNEAIKSIFASTEDVLKIYPEYLEIAKQTLKSNNAQTFEYVRTQVAQVNNIDEFKVVYSNMYSLFSACNFDFGKAVMPLINAKAAELIERTNNLEEFIFIADAISVINKNALDEEILKNKIVALLCKNNRLNIIHDCYLTLKAKNYIDGRALDSCLSRVTEKFIINETSGLAGSKEKLSKLENLYTDFRNNVNTNDFAPIQEVCSAYAKKFSGAANVEAVKGGNEVLYEIENDLARFSELWDIRGFIQKLAKIDVASDSNLKRKTSDCYRRVSDKLFKVLEYGNYAYSDISDFIKTVAPSVQALNENGVYDRELRLTRSDEYVAIDGVYRFVGLFYSLINGLSKADTLVDALKVYELGTSKIEQHEMQIKKMCEKYGHVILGGWADKHPKINISANFDKAVRQLRKRDNINTSLETAESFKKCKRRGGRSNKSPLGIILVCVIALVVISGVAVGGFFVFRGLSSNEQGIEERYIKQETIEEVEGYINAFNQGDSGETKIIVGQFIVDSGSNNGENGNKTDNNDEQGDVSASNEPGNNLFGRRTDNGINDGTDNGADNGKENSGSENTYKIAVVDKLGSKMGAKTIEATYMAENENSKKIYTPDKALNGKNYAIIIMEKTAEDGSISYSICDLFALPDDMSKYDFDKQYSDEFVKDEESSAFCTNLIKYVGHKQGLVKIYVEPTDEPKETNNPGAPTDEPKETNNPGGAETTQPPNDNATETPKTGDDQKNPGGSVIPRSSDDELLNDERDGI